MACEQDCYKDPFRNSQLSTRKNGIAYASGSLELLEPVLGGSGGIGSNGKEHGKLKTLFRVWGLGFQGQGGA